VNHNLDVTSSKTTFYRLVRVLCEVLVAKGISYWIKQVVLLSQRSRAMLCVCQ